MARGAIALLGVGLLSPAAGAVDDAEVGRRAYAPCAACHGADGGGRADGSFPRLAGQHRSVLVKQLVDIREGRRANPLMKPHADVLVEPRDVAEVADYVVSLRAQEPPGTGPGADLEQGGRLYARDCAACHGPRGEGDPEQAVPVLGGQHYGYLLRQVRAVAGGRRGNAHPGMERTLRDYSDAELRAVVDFAGRLPGAASPPELP